MIIANPIYDVVFKYLLDDLDIAKGLLSTIIGEEIETLTVQPQELSVKKALKEEVIRILRLDFKAVVNLESGEKKVILIELQKAKKLFDIMRFREYLGENYKKGEQIVNEFGEFDTIPLPIVTIYILGFKLEQAQAPVVKVDRTYRDVINNIALPNHIKEPFIENLTHDSFVIQIPYLEDNTRTKLERVLSVFNQTFKLKEDRHKLDVSEKDEDPLADKIKRRLLMAMSSEDIVSQMRAEDEIEKLFGRVEHDLDYTKGKLAESEKALEIKEKELESKDKVLKSKDKEIEIKDKELETERQKAESLEKELAELKKLLGK